MTYYRVVLVLKFVGVLFYAGGLLASFLLSSRDERKRAVHRVASPGLVLTWACGYLLILDQGIALTEAWILGGLLLSFVSQLALVHSVSRDRRGLGAFASAFVPLFFVLVLMVFRPTWSAPFVASPASQGHAP